MAAMQHLTAWTVIALVVTTACDRRGRAEMDSAGMVAGEAPAFDAPVVTESLKHADTLPLWTLGPAPLTRLQGSESDDNYDLYNAPDIVRLSNGVLVLAPQGGPVRLYGPNGKHLRTVGRKGQGPGEFGQIVQIGRIRGDTIVTFDNELGRISVLSPQGDFVRSHRSNPLVGQRLGGFTHDGHFIGEHSASRRATNAVSRDRVTLVSRNPESGEATPIVAIPGAWMTAVGQVPFSPSPRTAIAGRRIYATSADKYDILVFEDNKPLHSIRIEIPCIPVTTTEVRKWADNSSSLGDDEATTRYVEQVRDKAAKCHGHVNRMLTNGAGRLWVRPPSRVTSQPDRWLIHGPDGRLIARFEGSGSTIRAVGPDHVITSTYSDEGIPAVIEVWPLQRTH